ncbi:MAG TPA: ATP-binding protein, partial [Gammaproteobacteria bacterium]|nr:ATP-binding protein [Gammaproteobacteria bacterium]
IQLATERLRHKYANGMDRSDMETFDRLTNTIIQQVETMKEMVNSFTEFSQSSTSNMQSVDLNTLVKEVLDLYINLNRNASIETRFDDNLPMIRADISRLRQVFNNLLKNAFDACHNCSDFRLEISTQFVNEDREQYIEVRIKDSGSGIPKEIIDHMFDPYVTTKTKGSGLGLAIVKKIVEEHKGLVWLENNRGEPGACAVIRFPGEIMEESRDIQQDEERKAV